MLRTPSQFLLDRTQDRTFFSFFAVAAYVHFKFKTHIIIINLIATGLTMHCIFMRLLIRKTKHSPKCTFDIGVHVRSRRATVSSRKIRRVLKRADDPIPPWRVDICSQIRGQPGVSVLGAPTLHGVLYNLSILLTLVTGLSKRSLIHESWWKTET